MPARIVLISVPALASLVLGFVWYWKYSRTKANNDQISVKNKEGDGEIATKTKVSELTTEIGVPKRGDATEERTQLPTSNLEESASTPDSNSLRLQSVTTPKLSKESPKNTGKSVDTPSRNDTMRDNQTSSSNKKENASTVDPISQLIRGNVAGTCVSVAADGCNDEVILATTSHNLQSVPASSSLSALPNHIQKAYHVSDLESETSIQNVEGKSTVKDHDITKGQVNGINGHGGEAHHMNGLHLEDEVDKPDDEEGGLNQTQSSIPADQPIWALDKHAANKNQLPTTCDFVFPSHLCGLLIGRSGSSIKELRQASGARIVVNRTPYSADTQIVSVTGSHSEVRRALELLHERFPYSRYRVTIPQPVPSPVDLSPTGDTSMSQLDMPSGYLVEVVVSSVVAANQVFIQLPSHVTYTSLEQLTQRMAACYGNGSQAPAIGLPTVGMIVAVPAFNSWHRAQVVSVTPGRGDCDVKFVDYGGYSSIPLAMLRQIRSDFISLPFQAIECYLSNVAPLKDEEGFLPDAAVVTEQLVYGRRLQAELISWDEDGVASIQLYQIDDAGKLSLINRELVNRGVARWIENVS